MVTKIKHWDNLNSSNISSVSYNPLQGTDEEIGTLTVTFKSGMVYAYSQVPLLVVGRMLEAESIGKAFNELIRKGGYKFNRIR